MASYTKYSLFSFIALIAPIVIKVRGEGGCLFPSVSIAQSWLETGGNVPSWYNLGGYKVGNAKPTAWWDGASVNTATKEVYNGRVVNTSANWRAYKSIYHYFKDQDLLFNNPRYAMVKAAKTPQEQCNALYACGYATDPQYAIKLMSIIKANGLATFDVVEKKEDEEIMKLTDYQWGVLESNVQKLLDKKVISDTDWLVKVQKRTITNSELVWLNNVLIMRLA